jgi:hypothetical protein
MIKLYMHGYVSYDELVGWAVDKFTDGEYIEDTDDEHSDAMFDVLSQITTGETQGNHLEPNDFAHFINLLDTPQLT